MLDDPHPLRFESRTVTATLRDAQGNKMTRPVEVRRHPITGYEVMLGDMATFNAPEQTAELARSFW